MSTREILRRTPSRPFALITILFSALMLQPAIDALGGLAAQSDEIVLNRKLPMVNGHRFLTSNVVPEPFITTNLRSTLGFGLLLNARVPFVGVDGGTVTTLEGDIGLGILGLAFQQAITPWLAARVGFGGAFRTGTNGESLIAEGLNAGYEVSLGATAQLMRTSRVVVSAVGDFSSDKLFAMDPFGFAQTIVDRCREAGTIVDCDLELEDGEELVVSGSTSSFSGGLRAAYSPSAWLGLLGRAEIGTSKRIDESSQAVGDFGIAASVDADPLWNIPLGLLVSLNAQSFGGRGDRVAEAATRYGLGLFYTGRSEFLVGLEATFGSVDLAGEDAGSVQSAAAVFRIEYIF